MRYGSAQALPFVAYASLMPLVSWGTLKAEDVLFYAEFNRTLNATVSRGAPAPTIVRGQVSFADGIGGTGLLVGGAGTGVTYSSIGNIELDAGSIALWVKPLDWAVDNYSRYFFAIDNAHDSGAAGFLWLYKYFNSPVYWLVQRDMPQRSVYLVSSDNGTPDAKETFNWVKGKWTHLVASWSANQLSLYVDGRYCGTSYVPARRVLDRFDATFRVGGANVREKGTSDTVIDNLLIVRKPLTPDEAKLVHALGYDAFQRPDQSASKPVLEVTTSYQPSTKSAKVSTSLVGLRPEELSGLKVVFEVRGSAGNTIRSYPAKPVTDLHQTHGLSVSGLPNGQYRIDTHLSRTLSNGSSGLVAEATDSFTKSAVASWQGNHLGVYAKPPPPWSNLQRKGNVLSCWGRTYSWGRSALPEQIVSAGLPLLARPIELSAVINGKKHLLDNSKIIWDSTTPTRSTFHANGRLGPIQVAIKGWAEFDGFLWTQMTLTGSPNTSVADLVLEIPLNASAAALMQGPPPVPASGLIRNIRGALYSAPTIWLGNEQAGLQWSTDNISKWKLRSKQDMLQIKVGSDETILRLTFIDDEWKLSSPLDYSVGLQATPVKALSPKRREWEMSLNRVRAAKSPEPPGWVFYWQNWNRFTQHRDGPYGYQVASDATFKDLASWQNKNWRGWIYWNQHAIWSGDATLRTYGGEWNGVHRSPETTTDSSFTVADHSIGSIRDYLIWQNWKLLTNNPQLAQSVAGIYVDVTPATWTQRVNELGSQSSIYTVLGTRELQKRFYCMLRDKWPNLLIANHESGNMQMSQLAYADMVVTGEQYSDLPRLQDDLSYYHVLSLDTMRAEYLGSNLGTPVVFLPEIARAVEGDANRSARVTGAPGRPAAEHLLGLLWVHDVIPWVAYVNAEPFLESFRVKQAFGWDESTQFFGYWNNQGLVSTTSSTTPVVTSLYLHGGKVLFVTMNDSDVDANVELVPDWVRLGVGPNPVVVDAFAAARTTSVDVASLAMHQGKIELVVKARNFRALVAKSAGTP